MFNKNQGLLLIFEVKPSRQVFTHKKGGYMKKWILMLGVSFLSFSSFATDDYYKFGSHTCENFERFEESYNRKNPSTYDKIKYADCLLVKGNFVKEGEGLFRATSSE